MGKGMFCMTPESIDSFLSCQEKKGKSRQEIRRQKNYLKTLYEWLPANKQLTRDNLIKWRGDMTADGYAYVTVQAYVKGINQYLDHYGLQDIRFNRGHASDLAGKKIGYLTVLNRIGKNSRKDVIWKCQCRCGKVVDVAATLLLRECTTSCGCLNIELLSKANKYMEGTSLRQSLEDRILSSNSSGYTGVTRKREKWQASISYKGKRYYLGTYDRIEDAVKVRAEAKARVQDDAQQLLELYEKVHSRETDSGGGC